MAIIEFPTLQHWNYFLALEDDLNRVSRFVELAEHNFNTYSVELSRLLFAASSEVDVVAKQLCQHLSAGSRAESISTYRLEITEQYPAISQAAVMIPKFGLSLTPWERWAREETPLWWTAYNKVKHHRHIHYSEGNLRHALNSLAGLFSLLLFFYKKEAHDGKLTPDPSLFQIVAPFSVDQLFYSRATVYHLPEASRDAILERT